MDRDLYVIAEVDADGNVVEFARGGGSSAKSYIRAFDNVESAQRSLRFLSGEYTIMKVTGMEEAI